MKTESRSLTLALSMALLLSANAAHAGAVIVAANADASTLDHAQVQQIFMAKANKVGSANAVLVYQKPGAPTRVAFDEKVLGKPGPQLTGYWSKLIFTGRAKAPLEEATDAGVVAKVASTPGAIGYVDDAAVDASVKVVFNF